MSDDLFFLTGKALSVARLSGGLFDLTIGPLIEAWRMNRDSPDIPPRKQIVGALALIDWRDVVRDEKAKTIFLKRSLMRLDLGGFIKGHAADETVRILSGYGVTSALIDLGGNIFAMGTSPSGSPLQNPDQGRGVFLAIVQVTGGSVVTAGVYEHYFMKKGRRYHHIMDIRSGFPVENGLLSVTVIADTSTDADAFDTALLVMGKTRGLRLAEKLGLNVVMVDDHHRVWVTAGNEANPDNHRSDIFVRQLTHARLSCPSDGSIGRSSSGYFRCTACGFSRPERRRNGESPCSRSG